MRLRVPDRGRIRANLTAEPPFQAPKTKHARRAPKRSAPGAKRTVHATLKGLAHETAYRFRLVATTAEFGADDGEAGLPSARPSAKPPPSRSSTTKRPCAARSTPTASPPATASSTGPRPSTSQRRQLRRRPSPRSPRAKARSRSKRRSPASPKPPPTASASWRQRGREAKTSRPALHHPAAPRRPDLRQRRIPDRPLGGAARLPRL